MRLPALILITLTLGLVVAACGGDDEAVPGVDATVDTAEAADDLGQRADEVDRIVDEHVRGLGDVRSVDELSERLNAAQSELDQAAEDIQETDVPEPSEDDRAELEQRVRDLSSELDDVRGRVDEDDLRGALDELRDLRAVDELDRLVDRIRDEAGE